MCQPLSLYTEDGYSAFSHSLRISLAISLAIAMHFSFIMKECKIYIFFNYLMVFHSNALDENDWAGF